MSRALILTAVLSGSTLGVPGFAPDEEQRGRAILGRALADLGGAARVEAVKYWLLTGEGRENSAAELQGFAPLQETWRPHSETIAVDTTDLTVAWDRKTPRNDNSLRWRRFVLAPERTGVIDTTASQAWMVPTPVPAPRRRGLARRIPHLLMLEAAGARSATWREQRRDEGHPSDVIDVVLQDGSQLAVVIAQATPRVLRALEFKTYLPGAGEVQVIWRWRGWRRHSELGFVPTEHTVAISDVAFQEVKYSVFGTPKERPSALALPANARADLMPQSHPGPPLLATGEIKPGVHLLNVGGFTVMFVEFREFVVAVEAPSQHPGFEEIPARPGSTQPTSDFLAAIAKTVPSKPIRYLVVSHHHDDHLGGAGLAAQTGATVVVPSNHRLAAFKAIGAVYQGQAVIEVVSDSRTITDGERSIEVINVGRNPHTDSNLIVWLPRERVLFQGDLFYFSTNDAFPPPGRGTMNRFFAEWLQGRGLEPAAVYGVHNVGAAGPAFLELARKQ